MKVVLKVAVTGDDFENAMCDALRGLVLSGIHGLYFPSTINKESYILIDNPRLSPLNPKRVEQLQAIISRCSKHVTITDAEEKFMSLHNCRPYAHVMLQDLMNTRSSNSVLMDVVRATIRSVNALHLKLAACTSAPFSMANPMGIDIDLELFSFNSNKKVTWPGEQVTQIMMMVWQPSYHRDIHAQIEKYLCNTLIYLAKFFRDEVSFCIPNWTAIYSDGELPSPSTTINEADEDNVTIRINYTNNLAGSFQRSYKQHEIDIKIFYHELLKLLLRRNVKPDVQTTLNPATLNNALIELKLLNVAPESMSLFAHDVALASLISGLIDCATINISHQMSLQNLNKFASKFTPSKLFPLAELNMPNLEKVRTTYLREVLKLQSAPFTQVTADEQRHLGSVPLASAARAASAAAEPEVSPKTASPATPATVVSTVAAQANVISAASVAHDASTVNSGSKLNSSDSSTQEMSKGLSSKADRARALKTKYHLSDVSMVAVGKGLRMAAANGMADDIHAFVETFKVQINAQDTTPTSLKTALHWAVDRKHLECIKTLLLLKADPDIKNAEGLTAKDLAIISEQADIISLFKMSALGTLEANIDASVSNLSLAARATP